MRKASARWSRQRVQRIARSHEVEGLVELGSSAALAGLLVSEDPQTPRFGEGIGQAVEILVAGDDPRVADQGAARHGRFGLETRGDGLR